jgi:peroxiredoxin
MAELKVGDKAPFFELPVTMEETWKLKDHIGKSNIVVIFFPLAFSPPCHEELCSIRDGFTEWQGLNAQVVAISIDNPFVLNKWKEELGLQYPLLSDFNKTVGQAYGAFHDELGPLKGVNKRAAFVIDRGGKIQYTWVSEDPLKMPDFGEIKDVLDELK